MKCQILFSGKNKRKYFKMSAEIFAVCKVLILESIGEKQKPCSNRTSDEGPFSPVGSHFCMLIICWKKIFSDSKKCDYIDKVNMYRVNELPCPQKKKKTKLHVNGLLEKISITL